MSLISQAIPNLFNGVSQQPASLRSSSQAEAQENAYPAVATGLRKRNPTKHVAKLRNPIGSGAYVHILNRDVNERYVVVLYSGGLEVYDLNGVQKTVHFPDGTAYLAAPNPETNFSVITVADYSFIVNKNVPTGVTPITYPANPVNVGYVYVASSLPSHGFTVVVDEHSYTRETGTSGLTTAALADALAEGLMAIPAIAAGYTVSVLHSSVLKVTRLDGLPVAVGCGDSLGNTALRAISNGVTRFSELPLRFDTGYTVEIKSSPGGGGAKHYVKYTDSGWIEAPQAGSHYHLDTYTMPHKLVRNADGTFTFSGIEWADRLVGDNDSNPYPSFHSRTINDIFFYRNRLGLISDENVILSRAGEFFNFWAETATAVLDSDPIDISPSHTKVSILNHAIPFNTTLMLFSDQTQFQLTAGDMLTPKTVKVDAITEFESSAVCRPVALGPQLFFTVDKEGFTGIREYYVDAQTASNDAADVTAHVPTYIPSGVFKMAASSTEDAVLAVSKNDPNALYVYKFFWSREDKVQSAWSKFVFDSTDTIMSVEFVASVCYLVIQRADGVYLESLSLQPNARDAGFDYQIHLDRRVSLTGVYDAANNWTTWTLPYQEPGDMSVVLGAAFSSQAGALLTTTRPSSSTLRATGNYSSSPCIVGRKYTMRYRLSEQFVKDAKGVAITGGKLKLRRMRLSYANSGYFRAEVTPKARETYSYPFTGKVLGSSQLLIGATPIESGAYSFPILSGSEDLTVDIVNDTHLPSIFQAIEWDAEFTLKTSRR